ncbi:MAG: hypothetical protein M4579_000590 [Chaenotheca gracillima]|nr:MAG: hypothetical protein M4579_000590 [Chaenotheca gracillima]
MTGSRSKDPLHVQKENARLRARVLEYKASSANARPPSAQPAPAPRERIKSRFKKGPWLFFGVGIYGLAGVSTYYYLSYRRAVAESQKLDVPSDVSDRYDGIARDFDEEVDATERNLGYGKLRKELVRNAAGSVLEVSVGTGRNLEYYPLKKCRSLTFIDKSGEMINVAREKFNALHPQYSAVTFRVQDASTPVSSAPSSGYDTIVQTMGICSTAEPVKLLRNLGTMVNQDHGKILLLEHGKSHYRIGNRFLDSLASGHANRYGCWWNKDIGEIVKDSGLEVISVQRYHFGTTWRFELRPKRSSN